MRAMLDIVLMVLNLYMGRHHRRAILSWLIAFGVVNIRNDFVRAVWNLFLALTEPFLRPIRKFLPNTGGIDISPIILLLAIMFLERIIMLLHLSLLLLSAMTEDPPPRPPPAGSSRISASARQSGTRRRARFTPATPRSIRRSTARASRRRAPRPSPARSAIPRARSTTCSPSTSCSARRCRTSRSTPSPISATPTAGSSQAVYPGDTLSSTSEVIGLKENSNRQSGVVYVRSRGFNQRGETASNTCAG